MNIRYKKANKKDWKIVQSLLKKGVETSSGMYKAYTDNDEVAEYLLNDQVFLAMKGTIPIGLISYRLKNPVHAYISELVIYSKFQGQGHGSHAMQWLLRNLKDVKKISLVTHPHNTAAIILYLKSGFQIEEWKDNFFGDGEPRIELAKIRSKNV